MQAPSAPGGPGNTFVNAGTIVGSVSMGAGASNVFTMQSGSSVTGSSAEANLTVLGTRPDVRQARQGRRRRPQQHAGPGRSGGQQPGQQRLEFDLHQLRQPDRQQRQLAPDRRPAGIPGGAVTLGRRHHRRQQRRTRHRRHRRAGGLVLEDPAGNSLANNVSSSTYTNFGNLTVNSGNWRLTDGRAGPGGAVTLKGGVTTVDNNGVLGTGVIDAQGGGIASSVFRATLATTSCWHGRPDDERRQPARPVRQAVRHGRPDRRGHRPGHAGRRQRLRRRHHRPDRRHLAGQQRQPARQHSQQRPAILHAVRRRHLWRCPVRYRRRQQERRGHADADRREHLNRHLRRQRRHAGHRRRRQPVQQRHGMAGANTAFDLSAASAQTIGGLSGTGNVTLGGSALTLGSASRTYGGIISGAGTLTKTGTGTQRWTAPTPSPAESSSMAARSSCTNGSLAPMPGHGQYGRRLRCLRRPIPDPGP